MPNKNLFKAILFLLSISIINCGESKNTSDVFLKVTEGDYSFIKNYLQDGNSPDLNRVIINNCVYETRRCEGDTLLNTSLLSKQIEISKLLIDYGADFRSQSSSLISPLEIAIELDIYQFTEYLFKSEKINCEDKINGYSINEIAIQNNSLKTLELLKYCNK